MKDSEFEYIAKILYERSGLSLKKEKEYLLQSRLQPIARSHDLESVEDLVVKMRTSRDAALIHEVTQAMTTNETMFFRDNKPFERLKQVVLPEITASSRPKKIRLWSAACSSGQEPYSLAMCLQEEMGKYPGFSYEIVATDLCEKVVERAKEGLYTQFEVQRGLPIQMMIKYFSQAEDNHWQIKDELKRNLRFESHNLLDSAAKFGRFDIVYCRNVLIYFDETGKSKVLDSLAGLMNPPGFVFLGSAETIMGLTTKLKTHGDERGLYVLADQ